MNACTICGGRRAAGERWFLITENYWEDKLRILRWSDVLAAETGTHRVCSPPHARELVVHWMTTGSLDYPFARTAPPPPWRLRHWDAASRASNGLEAAAARIGELAVHRESVGRALSENPQSLNVILDELLVVLGARRETFPAKEKLRTRTKPSAPRYRRCEAAESLAVCARLKPIAPAGAGLGGAPNPP